jgi:DNA-binding transcriptional regulator YhcF (GntR family)
MSNNYNNYIDEIYETFIDEIINTRPLTTSRLREFDDAIAVNQQIVSNVYQIRRYLEMNEGRRTQHTNTAHDGSIHNQNNVVHNMINNIFEMILTPNNTLPSLTNFGEFEDVKITLTNDEFNLLHHDFITRINIDKECNVCMDSYNLNDKIVKLPCNHIFHTECIRNWLCNEKVTCPVCRMDTRSHR